MLKGKHIFILSTAKFDGPFESTSYTIAKHLAEHNQVYYVDYPFTWKDYFELKGTAQYKTRAPYFSFSSPGVIDTPIKNLSIVITPPLASINFLPEGKLYRFLLKINERVIVNRIKGIIKRNRIREFLYINSFNFHYPGVGRKIMPALTVYHCVDPLIAEYDRKHGLLSEKMLLQSSDLVICTSKQLFESKKLQNTNTYFIPNAADLAHSKKALDATLPTHPSLENIPRPIIGYFGNIERRMDYDLLEEVIDLNPEKSFVFAGPVSEEYLPSWFKNKQNVYLTGRLPYDEMPGMVKGFDVAIIPFKKDEVSRTIFPLKLFEYLGAGKPVVATDFNVDLLDFTFDTVAYCKDARTFSDEIDKALRDGSIHFQKRLRIAEQNTWERRAGQFSDLLESYLNKPRNN